MKSVKLALALLISLPLFAPLAAQATIDCHYPVTYHEWTGKITSGVKVRDLTCMDSNVLGTVAGGSVVAVYGEADGWYLIKTSTGLKGYVWQDFITVTDKSRLPDFSTSVEKDAAMKELEAKKLAEKEALKKAEAEKYAMKDAEKKKLLEKELAEKEAKKKELANAKLALNERLKGRILLQVENNGEAWYVHPDDGKRYYMKDGETCYEMMRAFGLGISNADFEKLKAGNADLKERLKGKIILKVESHGEAYYVHPENGSLHYLKDGKEAYRIMRELSLGITNKDLNQITDRDFAKYKEEFEAKRKLKEKTVWEKPKYEESEKETSEVTVEAGEVPAGVDLSALNQYWLEKINALRAERGLRQLVLDDRWVNTATEWAAYMGKLNKATHDRPDGKTMHKWIDTKGLEFTQRYSIDGWSGNYFTENIAYGWAKQGTTEAVQGVLDDTLEFYLSEAPYNGDHYRTIYHADWNSVGLGFYFRPEGDGYKVFVAIHYGSLVLE